MMPSKSGVDSVAERRLRPIYELIDYGNNKKAIQEADRVLKKQPDLLCAKVLKGLALLRLGKKRECEEIVVNVRKLGPVDENTLQAIAMCYRETQEVNKVCEIYEEAVAKEPNCEELHVHLFMSYVRIGDYKKQQQSALTLYKCSPKNPYYFWAVMSLVMQALESEQTVAQKVVLPLAERMIKKFNSDKKIEAEPEVLLYVMVLTMEGKYEESLNIIDEAISNDLNYQSLFLRKTRLLKELERWQDLNLFTKKLLLRDYDDYNTFKLYIETVFQMRDDKARQNNEEVYKINESLTLFNTVDYDLKSCINFINFCRDQVKMKKHKLRGPYLAEFYLYKRLLDMGLDAESILGYSIHNMVLNYIDEFGDKECCSQDLLDYLPLVKNQSDEILEKAYSLIRLEEGGVPNCKRQMMVYCTYFQLLMYFGKFENYSMEEKINAAVKLLRYYINGHEFNSNLLPMQFGYNDPYMVLIGHVLYDVFLETNNFVIIKDAISILEYGLAHMPSNYHIKFLIIKFYNILGATKAAYSFFELLEIKHIQYDSLSYLILPSLLTTGQYIAANQLLTTGFRFFNQNCKEITEQLTFAYKFGSFEKVIEFVKMQKKLKNSYNHLLISAEKIIMEFYHHSSSHESTLQCMQYTTTYFNKGWLTMLDDLFDNRDMGVYMNFYNFQRRMTQKYITLSHKNDISLLKIRMLMLYCLEASLNIEMHYQQQQNNKINGDLTNGNMQDNLSSDLATLIRIVSELTDVYKTLMLNMPNDVPKTVISGVEESRVFIYLRSPLFLPLFIDTMMFAHIFLSHSLLGNPSSYKPVEEKASEITCKFQELIQECIKNVKHECSTKTYGTQLNMMHTLHLTVEIICTFSIVCGALCSLVNKPKDVQRVVAVQNQKKKKGKKLDKPIVSVPINETGDEDPRFRSLKILKYFLARIKDHSKILFVSLAHLESAWENMENDDTPTVILRNVEESNLNEGMTENRWINLSNKTSKQIFDSYRSSVKEIRDVIIQKVEYMSNLPL